jgi:glycerol-3-phosphate O-acyltransferase/dihydroxyacetone phosphate acyltransferase
VRAVVDRALSWLARLMLRVFFREIEVVGAERIPRGAPLLIVANHVNSIVDPLLLMAFVDGRARVLAKSTLWSHPVLGPLLVLAGALPVYRRRDAQDVTKNFTTFARCHEELARGGSVALFPEGTSHNLPHRMPLKTGAARIALETEARSRSAGLRILPVGVVYEAKDRFRSRALVNIGAPIDPAPEARSYPTDGRRAVRALTGRIARGLESVTTSYETWGEARLLDLAAAIVGDASLAERFVRSRAFLAAYHELREHDPRCVARVVRSLEEYEGRLRTLSLADEDVATGVRRGQAWRELALNLPMGALGSLLNVAPYRLTGWVTRRFARTPDEPATYMLLTALLVFPASWLLMGLLGALASGPATGLLAATLAPATGSAALRLREALRILGQPRPAARLAREREALARQIEELAGRTA